jgi:hypothetical protein
MQHVPAGLAAVEAEEASIIASQDGGGDGGRGAFDGGPGKHDDGGEHRGVAILLGAAAIVAAIVGALASGMSSDASDAWQSALRTEVKRSAGAVTDIRYLYQSELPPVITILGARAQRDALRDAAAQATGYTAQALTIASGAQANLATAIEPSYELSTNAAYALPGGGVNLAQRLADLRRENPDLVALDPDKVERQGDALAARTHALTLALLPLGLTALLGTLAQAFARRRRILLAAGSVTLVAGAIAAVAAEVLA